MQSKHNISEPPQGGGVSNPTANENNPPSQYRNRSRVPFEIRDLPVTLICFLGAAFCFGVFRADLNRTMDRFAEPIGTITYKRQAAQRRFSDRVLWIRLSKGAPVYQGDYVRTAELSQATMHFKDGADIDLAENTLIQLLIEDGKNIVDLSGGNLSVAVSGPGAIRVLVSGENRVEIGAGARVNASMDASGVFTMLVLEGEVTANGESFGAGKSFSSEALAARAVPLSPRPDTYFLAAGGTAAVRFSWSALNYSGPTRFELALDRRFRRLEQSLASGEESLLVNLNPGVYWWRVYPEQSAGGLPGEGPPQSGSTTAGKIVVVPPVSPKLIYPADGQHFYPGTEIRFSWKSGALPPEIQDTGDYILELADSPAFETPLLSFNVEGSDGGSLVYGYLEEQTWYWRVRQLFSGVELAAAPSRFTIASTRPAVEPSPPTTPETAITAEAASSPKNAPAASILLPETPAPPLPPPSGMNPPDRFVAGPETIRLSRRMVFDWNGVEGANTYVFSVFKESAVDFTGTKGSGKTGDSGGALFRAETAETSYTIEDLGLLGNGSFVWRVEALVKNNGRIERRGSPGESRFTLDVPAPGNPRIRETGTLYGL
jgi:hypothetical protein